MIYELYGRDPSDPNYDSTILETTDGIESVLNKIRLILFTTKSEVMGQPNFGIDLDALLFRFELNSDQLSARITEQIAAFVPESRDFDIRVEVTFYPGDYRDSALLDIIINEQKFLGLYVE